LLGGDELRKVLSVVTQQIKRVHGCHISEFFVFPTPKRHRRFPNTRPQLTLATKHGTYPSEIKEKKKVEGMERLKVKNPNPSRNKREESECVREQTGPPNLLFRT